MTMEELRERAHALPLKPGVYLMQNARNEVIYVGKAKVLKHRVSQYFQDQSRHNDKTRAMVRQIDHFDVIVVQSEFEALVLECSLIKRHMPRYNILLKDDKGYPYIRLDVQAEYPRFSLVARAAADGARYFGPYGSRGASQGMIDALNKALKLPSCSRRFPRDIGRERPCLNLHLGLCEGWCLPSVEGERYRDIMQQAIRILEGRLDEVVSELTAQMERAAESLRFELAAQLRDRIASIRMLSKRQKAVAGSLADTDVVGYHRGETRSCFVVLHYMAGELAAKDWELLPLPMEEEVGETVATLTAQYYSKRGSIPRQILLPCDIDGQGELARMLTESAGRKVEVLTPQRGDRMELVRLANDNAAEETARATSAAERQFKLLELLGTALGLTAPPRRMEAFDISHTGGSDMVAAMTVHVDGKPLRRAYRQFRMRGLEHADDYAAISQAVERRLRRYLEQDERFSPLPDLMLMDGGVGQVRAAWEAMERTGVQIPVFGMVKDARHRTRALVSGDGREIGIQHNPELFALVGRIQEETHRSAIAFHHKQQSRRVKGSALDAIPGVGPRRRQALLGHFKSLKRIRAASVEQLAEVVDRRTAQAVYDSFHQEEGAHAGDYGDSQRNTTSGAAGDGNQTHHRPGQGGAV